MPQVVQERLWRKSRKIFRLKPSSLRQNMVRCIYKRPHTPRRLAKRFFSSLTPMWKLPCSGLAAVEQMSCFALRIQRPQAITRMRTSGIVLLSRYKAALTARGFWKSFTICMITARLSDWPVLFMILKARVPISKRTTQMRTTYLCFLCLRHIL